MKNQIDQWKNERKDGFKRFIEKYFGKEVSREQINSIPQYFVDSIEARKNNNSSYNELCHLLAWAGQLKLIKDELPTIKVKVGAPIIENKTETQYGKTWQETRHTHRRYRIFGHREYHGKKFQNQTIIYLQRTQQIFTDGSVEYSPWKEIRRETKQVTLKSW